jgi:hypothetical protein
MALEEPPRKEVLGLWGLLFIASAAAAPNIAVAAWHREPSERYDFVMGQERIEVKSSTGRIRRHRFALAQLQPPEGTTLCIASVLAEPSSGGTSLRDLLQRLRARLSRHPDLLFRMEVIVARTLGQALAASLDEAFDEQLAGESLAFYPVMSIPKPTEAMPHAVSDVRFTADLTDVAPLPRGDVRALGALFAACLTD